MGSDEVGWLRRISEQLARMEAKYVPPPRPGRLTHIDVSIGPVTTQGATGMQIHDNEQFDLTLAGVDSKGVATPDTFTATSSDETVCTVTDSDADGKTFTVIAGQPGSAVITIAEADGGPVTVTEAVDVVAGDLATITVTEGPVTTQGAAAPAPA